MAILSSLPDIAENFAAQLLPACRTVTDHTARRGQDANPETVKHTRNLPGAEVCSASRPGDTLNAADHRQFLKDENGDDNDENKDCIDDDDSNIFKICEYGDRRVLVTHSNDSGGKWSALILRDDLLPPEKYTDERRNKKDVRTSMDNVGPGAGIQLSDGTLVVPARSSITRHQPARLRS